MRKIVGVALAAFLAPLAAPAQAATGAGVAWSALYDNGGIDAPAALAVDTAGNVYVAGSSEGAAPVPDYLTVKYSPAGQQLWTARYDGAGGFDLPAAVAVDGEGNVYVTGGSEAASGVNDYATVKYGPGGNQLWVRRFDAGTGAHDQASDIALDPQGNAYVTGWSYRSSTSTDYLTIKYDRTGNVVWTARTSGTGAQNDYAYAVRVDDAGNVFVTGEVVIDFASRYRDYGTVKYDAGGAQVWLRTYTSPIAPGSLDAPHAMELDPAGNVLVTGESWGQGPGCCTIDWATIKYDTEGSELWVRRLNGSSSGQDIAQDLAVDPGGNVVVTGQVTTDTTNMGVVKYSPAGQVLWRDVHDEGSLDEAANVVAVDSRGNAFISGYRHDGTNDFDWITLAYTSQGRLTGRARFGGTANFIDTPSDIAVVPGGVVVTGQAYNANLWDYMTIKYAP